MTDITRSFRKAALHTPAAPLPIGVGLALGAAASLALWFAAGQALRIVLG